MKTQSSPGPWKFTHPAMACVFELIIHHPDPLYSRQAAREAFHLVDSLEGELSRFRSDSDVSRIAQARANQPVRLGEASFRCITLAREVSAQSDGAFDITMAPLVDYWRTQSLAQYPCPPPELLQLTGMARLHLDPHNHSISKEHDALTVDLGGIAKGHALDEAARLLHDDWDIKDFLIHSGWSTVYARGSSNPRGGPWTGIVEARNLAPLRIYLNHAALSGSAAIEKEHHVVDPRSGLPLAPNRQAWAIAPSAALADALSTAAVLLDPRALEALCLAFPGSGLLLAMETETGAEVVRAGQFTAIH